MSKRQSENNTNQVGDGEYSSESQEMYRPTGVDEELVVDEEYYDVLDYMDMEWPTMSLDMLKSKVIFGTFPEAGMQAKLCAVNLNDQTKRPTACKIDCILNKVRVADSIFALSDKHLAKYGTDLTLIKRVDGKYRFGLHVSDIVVVGTEDGLVEVYDKDLNVLNKFTASLVAVECVGYENGKIFTGSIDGIVRIFDRSGNLLKSVECGGDVNALDVRGEKLVFGDEQGDVHIVDLVTEERTTMEWHRTPISFVRWKNDEVFASGSDEQVCLWDVTLEDYDDDEVPTNLLFVHQGQKFYKDCTFHGENIVVTSEDGVCIFKPIDFSLDLVVED